MLWGVSVGRGRRPRSRSGEPGRASAAVAARLCVIVMGLMVAGLMAAVLPAAPGRAAERWAGLATTMFQNYGRDQGLPHPVPTALAQDRAGFLWIGTQGGLARWDGYRFRSYKADPATPGSLPDDYVQALHVDPAGRLWIGTGAGRFARYDAAADRFVVRALGPAGGLVHIGGIVDDGAGGLWIGVDDGLRHLDPANGTVSALRRGMARTGDLPAGAVKAMLRDAEGALWIGTAAGLARRGADESAFVAVRLGQVPVGVSALFEDPGGRIWIGTMRHGLFVVDRVGAAPRPVGAGRGIPATDVAAICAAGDAEIWAGLRGGGIVAIDRRTGAARSIRHDRANPNSLAHDDIWALLRDNAGSIWAGGTGGLSYHPNDGGAIATVYGGRGGAGGLRSADVLAILATRDRRVWLGYVGGGADLIDPVAGRVKALAARPGQPGRALPPEPVFAIAESAAGTVYFGTRRGLYALPRGAATPGRVIVPRRDPQSAVNALTYEGGTLWIGGVDDGLWAYRPGDRRRPVATPAAATLSSPNVTAILRGRGDDLWIGTRNGLDRLDLVTGKIERIPADPADPHALPGGFVAGLALDRAGRLWIGMFGGGLAAIVGRAADGRPQLRRFGLAQGLPHRNVDSLQAGAAGILWAGTDDGLARIDPAKFAIRAVRRAEGAALRDYFVGARGSGPAGEALFGAKDGLSVVRSAPLPRWRFRPPIVVTDLRIGGAPQAPGQATDPAQPLTLDPSANSLAVEFAALDFTAPERNLYAYRLEGYDRGWIRTDASRRLASYTNLAPGAYVLRVRGSNRDGLWSAPMLAVAIRVLPAWYQQLWFRLAAALLILLATAALVRWRTTLLRRRQRELEHRIALQTADLRAVNERLRHLAQTDPLTGCTNRRHFIERAEALVGLAQRQHLPLSLAIIDLDEFKQINDTFGHPAGDAVLAMVGRAIDDHVRASDLVGRIGGEEFALLMPQTDAANAAPLADRLREVLSRSAVELEGGTIGVTASLGIAQLRDGEDFDGLYGRADAALYAAKQAGRNRIQLALVAHA